MNVRPLQFTRAHVYNYCARFLERPFIFNSVDVVRISINIVAFNCFLSCKTSIIICFFDVSQRKIEADKKSKTSTRIEIDYLHDLLNDSVSLYAVEL